MRKWPPAAPSRKNKSSLFRLFIIFILLHSYSILLYIFYYSYYFYTSFSSLLLLVLLPSFFSSFCFRLIIEKGILAAAAFLSPAGVREYMVSICFPWHLVTHAMLLMWVGTSRERRIPHEGKLLQQLRLRSWTTDADAVVPLSGLWESSDAGWGWRGSSVLVRQTRASG